MADELGVPTFSVVNIVRSLIARSTSCGVYLNAGRGVCVRAPERPYHGVSRTNAMIIVWYCACVEIAVASTKAFTNQVAVLAQVAVWFSQERGVCWHSLPSQPRYRDCCAVLRYAILIAVRLFTTNIQDVSGREDRRRAVIEGLHRLSTNAGMTINRVRAQCQELAKKLEKTNNMFVLGKGPAYSVALEGALKIKEITYVHAEGCVRIKH
jgi:glutamine---fructose-6-phosphate transaminase (isomerizing)